MGVKGGQYTWSDPSGNPVWDAWTDPYGRTNQQLGLDRAYTLTTKGINTVGAGVRQGDEIAEKWRLPEGTDYLTRWRMSQTADAHSGWNNPQQKDKRGYEWGRAHQNPYAAGIRMSDWFVPIDPGERADLTTGKFAQASAKGRYSPGGRRTPGQYKEQGTWGAMEVLDWDAYDKAGKEWLREQGKSKFRNLDDVHSYQAWEALGVEGRKAKKAAEELAAQKESQRIAEEQRLLNQPKPIDVSGAPGAVQGLPQQPTIQQITSSQPYQDLTAQIAALQGQQSLLQGNYSTLQGQHATASQSHQAALADWLNQAQGFQSQIGALGGQLATTQGSLTAANTGWEGAKKTISELQHQAATYDQRNRTHNAWMSGNLGLGTEGVKHGMFIRPQETDTWSPSQGFGRGGPRISSLNI